VHVEELEGSGSAPGGIVLAVGAGRLARGKHAYSALLDGKKAHGGKVGGLLEGLPEAKSRTGEEGSAVCVRGGLIQGQQGRVAEEDKDDDEKGVDDGSDSDASSETASQDGSILGSASDHHQQQQQRQREEHESGGSKRPVLAVLERKLAGRIDPSVPMEVTRYIAVWYIGGTAYRSSMHVHIEHPRQTKRNRCRTCDDTVKESRSRRFKVQLRFVFLVNNFSLLSPAVTHVTQDIGQPLCTFGPSQSQSWGNVAVSLPRRCLWCEVCLWRRAPSVPFGCV